MDKSIRFGSNVKEGTIRSDSLDLGAYFGTNLKILKLSALRFITLLVLANSRFTGRAEA